MSAQIITKTESKKSESPASTNGWDLVSAIRFPDVNRSIVLQKSSPDSFDYSSMDPDFGTLSLKGTFNDWQLSGGDGPYAEFDIPLINTEFGLGSKSHSYPHPMTAVIQVNFLWVEAESNMHHLKVDFANEVLVMRIEVGDNKESDGSPITETRIAFMKTLLQDWFKDHGAVFDHVFAKLDIAEDVGEGDLGWLQPTDKLYGITSSNSDDKIENKILGIMCMTEGRPSPGDHNVSPFAIPKDRKIGFLISPDRFLHKMILNGLPLLFLAKGVISNGNVVWQTGVTIDDFEVKDQAITNKVPLKFHTQLFKDKKVEPMLDANKFFLRYRETGVEMDFTNLYFEYSPGISVHMDHISQSRLLIAKDRKFDMKVYDTTTTASIKSETWVMVLEIVGSIAAAILGAAAGSALGGAVSGGSEAIVEGGLEATIDTITVSLDEGVEDGVENALVNVAEDSIEEGASEAAESGEAVKNPGNIVQRAFGRFKDFYSKNTAKFWLSLAGGALGGSTGTIASIIKAVANDGNDNKKMPTLDDLGTQALSPITWPDLEKDNLIIVSGGINGSLQIGFDIKES